MYYTYMLRCIDNSIYTGITNDIKRRFNEHLTKSDKCAKYTKNHQVLEVIALFKTDTKSNAQKLEYRIKRLSKKDKEQIIISGLDNIKKLEIELNNYERIIDTNNLLC